MIKIGKVQHVLPLHKDFIVSIDICKNVEVNLKVGDIIQFEKCGEIPISGLKFWPKRRAIDLLIKNTSLKPQTKEVVYVSQPVDCGEG